MTDTPDSDPDRLSTSHWPASFPHIEIDRLIARLRSDMPAEREDVERLLQLVVRETQRLRETVVKLSVDRLSEAEREAHDIVAEANAWADDVRSRALEIMDERLDEADELAQAMRRALAVEHHLAQEPPEPGDDIEDRR